MSSIPGALGVGIALGVVGSVAINLGNNLQALGMTRLEIKKATAHLEELANGAPPDDTTNDVIDARESPVWIFGTATFITGSLLTFAAFAFAPQSILASIEGIQVRIYAWRNILGSLFE